MDRDLKTESSRGTRGAQRDKQNLFGFGLLAQTRLRACARSRTRRERCSPGLGLNDDTLDSSFPIDDLIRLVGMEQAWVACTEDDRPVGMVFASVREGAVYVEELDVMPEFGRRGLGSRLLNCVCDWAREQRCAEVTLSTFRDVPWNGPFYRKHGFRDLQPAEWTPGMWASGFHGRGRHTCGRHWASMSRGLQAVPIGERGGIV